MSNQRQTILGHFGLLLWTVGLVAQWLLDDPRLRFVPYLLTMAVATGGWLLLCAGRPTRRHFTTAIGLAIGARLFFWADAPAFSEDVFRYVYEGRLVWYLGPAAPFAHAPVMGPQLGLPPELLDAAWFRINHPEISTIYPPFSQLTFVAAGGLGLVFGHTLAFLKALLIAADLGTWFFVHKALEKTGQPTHLSLLWGACPLVILEVGRDGHADSLTTLGLAAGIYGFVAARPVLGQVGHAVSALAKLNGGLGLLIGARSTRRGLLAGGVLLVLLGIPWLLLGLEAGRGLNEYASRWRSGDGMFSVLLWVSEVVLQGEWRRIGQTTLTAHTLARGLTALSFLVVLAALLRSRFPKIEVPARTGTAILFLLLFAPTLHPWYALWVLPFCAAAPRFAHRRAAIALIALVPLLHHPGWLELSQGVWRDESSLRAIVHLPVWSLLLLGVVRGFGFGYAAAHPKGHTNSCHSTKAY